MAWLFVDDKNGLSPCPYGYSMELETYLQKHLASPTTCPQTTDVCVDGTTYRVDVVLMEQLNTASKRMRALQRWDCKKPVSWEIESNAPDSVCSASNSGAYKRLSLYFSALLEFLRVRQNSLLHTAFGHQVIKLAGGEALVDLSSMTLKFSSYGGLVATTSKLRRIIQADDDDDTPATAPAVADGAVRNKRQRAADSDDAQPRGARAPPTSHSGVVAATVEAAAFSAAAGGTSIPATLVEEDEEPCSASPTKPLKRGPAVSHTVAESEPPAPRREQGLSLAASATPSSSWSPPGWGAPTATPSPTPLTRLVFPSISTAVFMFDLARAAQSACSEIAVFLAKYPASTHPWIQLCLIDAPSGPDTETIKAFKKAWAEKGKASEARFTFLTADVSSLVERKAAGFIANASNASFNGGPTTGGFNRALYLAAGDKELQHDTRTLYPKGGSVGPCYEVPLRHTSPLYAEGTRYVLHVIGPNMNPSRPNCLYEDYTTGTAQLADCYRNMLETYVTTAAKLLAAASC